MIRLNIAFGQFSFIVKNIETFTKKILIFYCLVVFFLVKITIISKKLCTIFGIDYECLLQLFFQNNSVIKSYDRHAAVKGLVTTNKRCPKIKEFQLYSSPNTGYDKNPQNNL